MKRKPDRYLNGLFKTPYDLKLTPIFVISLLNVAMAVGALLKIEITRRLLQAVFSSDGRALLRGFFFLAVFELIYSGMVHLNDYQYAKTEGDIYRQLLDKVLDKNERLRSLSNCPMGANDRFSMASEDCANYVSAIMEKASLFADFVLRHRDLSDERAISAGQGGAPEENSGNKYPELPECRKGEHAHERPEDIGRHSLCGDGSMVLFRPSGEIGGGDSDHGFGVWDLERVRKRAELHMDEDCGEGIHIGSI